MRTIMARTCLGLIAVGIAVSSIFRFHSSAQAYARGSCSVVHSPSADVPAIGALDTGADVIAAFTHARQAEGCSVPLNIDAVAFNQATPQIQMFMLFNAERLARGLSGLRLDTTLLSQIDSNHSKEMAQYHYFGHPSPINYPGLQRIFNRDTVNRRIGRIWRGLGENIAAGYSPAGAVYAYMYTDSVDAWGHRHNILGTFEWVGIGVATGGFYGRYYSSDFLSGSYNPPAIADSTAPILSAPAIISGTAGGTVTVRVTGVFDSGAGGRAAITGVVFSAGEATQTVSGKPNTVSAKWRSFGVWTATLDLPLGATLHAVAVDGSGNYTDCTVASTSANCQSHLMTFPGMTATKVVGNFKKSPRDPGAVPARPQARPTN